MKPARLDDDERRELALGMALPVSGTCAMLWAVIVLQVSDPGQPVLPEIWAISLGWMVSVLAGVCFWLRPDRVHWVYLIVPPVLGPILAMALVISYGTGAHPVLIPVVAGALGACVATLVVQVFIRAPEIVAGAVLVSGGLLALLCATGVLFTSDISEPVIPEIGAISLGFAVSVLVGACFWARAGRAPWIYLIVSPLLGPALALALIIPQGRFASPVSVPVVAIYGALAACIVTFLVRVPVGASKRAASTVLFASALVATVCAVSILSVREGGRPDLPEIGAVSLGWVASVLVGGCFWARARRAPRAYLIIPPLLGPVLSLVLIIPQGPNANPVLIPVVAMYGALGACLATFLVRLAASGVERVLSIFDGGSPVQQA